MWILTTSGSRRTSSHQYFRSCSSLEMNVNVNVNPTFPMSKSPTVVLDNVTSLWRIDAISFQNLSGKRCLYWELLHSLIMLLSNTLRTHLYNKAQWNINLSYKSWKVIMSIHRYICIYSRHIHMFVHASALLLNVRMPWEYCGVYVYRYMVNV